MPLSQREFLALVHNYLLSKNYQVASFGLRVHTGVTSEELREEFQVSAGALVELANRGAEFLYTRGEEEIQRLCSSSKFCLKDALAEWQAMQKKGEDSLSHLVADSSSNGTTSSSYSTTDTGNESTNQLDAANPLTLSVLRCHQSEVFYCSWNPRRAILATGSADSCAILWYLRGDQCSGLVVLPHLTHSAESSSSESVKVDVTGLAWHPCGELLATASNEGSILIWNHLGTKMAFKKGHEKAVMALKWNKTGQYLLSAGVDTVVKIWSPPRLELLQTLCVHTKAIVDAEWLESSIFATGSIDQTIKVCKVFSDSPLTTMADHRKPINFLKVHPVRPYLASCSDDAVLKIWRLDSCTCLHTFTGHERDISMISWNPDVDSRLHIASGSHDCTVRFWNIDTGTCVMVLEGHVLPLCFVVFSPDGHYLVSSSYDRSLIVWDVSDGQDCSIYAQKVLQANASDIAWNDYGDMFAIAGGMGYVAVAKLAPPTSRS